MEFFLIALVWCLGWLYYLVARIFEFIKWLLGYKKNVEEEHLSEEEIAQISARTEEILAEIKEEQERNAKGLTLKEWMKRYYKF